MTRTTEQHKSDWLYKRGHTVCKTWLMMLKVMQYEQYQIVRNCPLSEKLRTSSIYIRKDKGRWSEAVGTAVSRATSSVVIWGNSISPESYIAMAWSHVIFVVLEWECTMKFPADGLKSGSCIAVPVWGKHTVTSGLVPHRLVKLGQSYWKLQVVYGYSAPWITGLLLETFLVWFMNMYEKTYWR